MPCSSYYRGRPSWRLPTTEIRAHRVRRRRRSPASAVPTRDRWQVSLLNRRKVTIMHHWTKYRRLVSAVRSPRSHTLCPGRVVLENRLTARNIVVGYAQFEDSKRSGTVIVSQTVDVVAVASTSSETAAATNAVHSRRPAGSGSIGDFYGEESAVGTVGRDVNPRFLRSLWVRVAFRRRPRCPGSYRWLLSVPNRYQVRFWMARDLIHA